MSLDARTEAIDGKAVLTDKETGQQSDDTCCRDCRVAEVLLVGDTAHRLRDERDSDDGEDPRMMKRVRNMMT